MITFIKKVSRTVSCLAKLRHSVSIEILREVYHALIHSYVRYGIVVWGNASDTSMQPLSTLLNKAIRIITFAPYGPLDMKPIYKELEILNLQQIFCFERGKLMFKSKKNIIPVNIANHFDPIQSPNHSYNLRRRQNYSSHFVFNTVTGRKSIQNVGEQQWNDLPRT